MIQFKRFKKYKIIAVTGPQRSGTHFFAWVLSKELEYTYIAEDQFNNDNMHDFMEFYAYHVIFGKQPYVIQCPDLCHLCHTFP